METNRHLYRLQAGESQPTRTKLKAWLFPLCAILLAISCTKKPTKGENLSDYIKPDATIFSFDSNSTVFTSNQIGTNIPGVAFFGMSLVLNRADLAQRTNTTFCIVYDPVVCGIIEGEYWRSQQAGNVEVGMPNYLADDQKYVLLTVDSTKRVIEAKVQAAAIFKISVSAKDFGRPYSP